MVEKNNTKKIDVVREGIPVDVSKKLKDLKIELLKNPTKRGRIKKEIARLLTMARNSVPSKKGTEVPASSGKNLTKSEDKA
ncbi:MAG: hypothetical protein ABIH79_03305 [archaeon]